MEKTKPVFLKIEVLFKGIHFLIVNFSQKEDCILPKFASSLLQLKVLEQGNGDYIKAILFFGTFSNIFLNLHKTSKKVTDL